MFDMNFQSCIISPCSFICLHTLLWMRRLFLCSIWEKTECSTNEERSLKHDCSQAEKGQPNTDNQQVPEELRPDISSGLTWPGKCWSPQCTEISDGSSLLDHLSVCKIKLVRAAPRHIQLHSNEPTVWHRDIKWCCTKDDKLIKSTQGHTPRTKPWKELTKVQVPVFPLLSTKTKLWVDGVSDNVDSLDFCFCDSNVIEQRDAQTQLQSKILWLHLLLCSVKIHHLHHTHT